MSKKATTNNIAKNEESKSAFQIKTENTKATLKKLFNKLKGVKFLSKSENETRIKAYELCLRVLGPSPDIKIPDFQRAPYTFKQVYMDRLMSGLITGLDTRISRVVIAIYKGEWYIVDGLQRCSANFLFFLGLAGFSLIEDDCKVADTLEIYYNVSEGNEKKHYQLDKKYKDFFDNLEFTVEFVECKTKNQMRDVFMAINTSTTVSSAAKTIAYADNRIRAEVDCLMKEKAEYIERYPVRNLKGKNNGDAVVNQKTLFTDFLLMCAYPNLFTGQKQMRYLNTLTAFRKKYVRLNLSNTKIAEAKTLFNKCMDLMDKLCIDPTKKNLTTYRITFILVLNIIKNGHEKYFEEANVLSTVLKNMTVLPTTDGQCSNLRLMHEKEIDMYDEYIMPYINSIDSGLEEIYTSTDGDDDNKFVA